jgi:hypothetical protein
MLALLTAWAAGVGHVHAQAPQTTVSAPIPQQSSIPTTAVTPLLGTYCVGCHNSRTRTAGLELDRLGAQPIASHAAEWEKIVTKLRTGEMPPTGRPRPDPATYRTAVIALERELDALSATAPQPVAHPSTMALLKTLGAIE